MKGGTIPGSEAAAFRVINGGGGNVPVLIAAPHGGREYPPAIRKAMRDPAFTMKRIEDRFVDILADRVAKETGAGLLVADAPRAMIDLNRAEGDIDWGMVVGGRPQGNRQRVQGHRAHNGLGLVPRRLQGLGEIWREPLQSTDLDIRLSGIHRPYHHELADRLEAIRTRWGAALLLDLHSMPPLRSNGAWEPARFVVGDRFGTSCDAVLTAAAFSHFARCDRRVAHNRPYAGGYVLERHGDPGRRIHAMQLEVDRSLYLDDALDALAEDLDPLVEILAGLIRALAVAVAEIANRGPDLEAAE